MKRRRPKQKSTFQTAWIALLLAVTSNGCAALSLFSTTHEHHYDSNPTVERRLEAIEQRLSAVERSDAAAGTATTAPSARSNSASSAAITE